MLSALHRINSKAVLLLPFMQRLHLQLFLFLGGLAWGPSQFRISEAVVVIALFTADALGLTLYCSIQPCKYGHFWHRSFGIVRRSLWFLWQLLWYGLPGTGKNTIALLGPRLNAVIVPAYLPILLQGLGFYTIPFTTIELGWIVILILVWFHTTGLGEVVLYTRSPLARALTFTCCSLLRGLAAESAGN